MNLVLLVPLLTSVHAIATCPLLWNSKQNLGYEQGFQLQVCCNVSSVQLWPISVTEGHWRRGNLVYEKNFEDEPEDMWSELQVSVCDDKSDPTLGYAEAREGVKCTHYVGQTLTVPADAIEMNKWYLVCYTKQSGCTQCHIEALCDNEFTNECADMWMLNSVSTITNESMTLWLRIGKRFPFIDNTQVHITVSDQARGKLIAQYQRQPILNKEMEVELRGVEPSGWYLVETCLSITPPKRFVETNRVQLNEASRKMCKRGSYRTKANSASTLLNKMFILSLSCTIFDLFLL